MLDPLETIRLQDALLDFSDGKVSEAVWPKADFIIGNPPFLGGNKFRQELGDEYSEILWRIYEKTLPSSSDLYCYFFEQARSEVAVGNANRVGLLASNSIRHSSNRRVLDRIKASGEIFMAWSDEPWILDGAPFGYQLSDLTMARKNLLS